MDAVPRLSRALPGKKKWQFNQSSLFLDFLAGNQTFHCTPWGNPTRTYFGWQRPCYLLGEGYAKSFTELMETTDWDKYGVGGLTQGVQRPGHRRVVARGTPGGQTGNLISLCLGVGLHDRAIACGQRRRRGFGPAVHANHDGFAGFNPPDPFCIGFDQAALHVVNRGHGPAHRVDLGKLCARALLEFFNLAVHGGVAVEEIVEFQKVGFIGEDLLHPERPLLVPGPRKPQSLVPCGQLHGARDAPLYLRAADGGSGAGDAADTTPDAIVLQRTLKDIKAAGAAACAMEVSSIGLIQVTSSPVAMPISAPTVTTPAPSRSRLASKVASPKPSAAIGVISGDTSMAPMTTATDDCSRPSVAIPADSTHIST